MQTLSVEQSGAFIETFALGPTKDGPLRGLTFAVKDLIDVAGYRTGCGNPKWLAMHPPASVSAVCAEQLLAAGATCMGKTITDEFAFSLLGENFHYGTPLNPAAPERVPGGSSSGSASAVACGCVDFAIGTDTGGSVRVPASNCGIWGWRPSHGLISVAGVMPFAPTLDTVGVFTRSGTLLEQVADVLLATEDVRQTSTAAIGAIHLVREVFDVADAAARDGLDSGLKKLRNVFGERVRESSLGELCGDERAANLDSWLTIYRVLQGAEFDSCLGSWIESARPKLGPAMSAGVEAVRKLDRTRISESVGMRELFCRRLNRSLASGDLLCVPTAPSIAPLKDSNAYERSSDYYRRTLSINAIAGVGRLPQVTMPMGEADGVPVGLSLIAKHGEDKRLISTAKSFAEQV